MGFIDRIALKRVEGRFRPFMRADERMIEYDIADVNPVGRQIPVLLSSRAVYMGTQTVVRVPYARILQLESRGPALVAMSTFSGKVFLINITGTPTGDIYRTISFYLDKAVRHQQTVSVPGGQVHAACRQVDEDGSLTWVLGASDGVELDDGEVRSELAAELAPVIERLNVPLP